MIIKTYISIKNIWNININNEYWDWVKNEKNKKSSIVIKYIVYKLKGINNEETIVLILRI